MIDKVKNTPVAVPLSQQDREHIDALDCRLQLIRDRVGSVVHRYQTAVYLVGRPGTSKTYTVRDHLEKADVPWAYQNARITPMGLFEFLAEHPEHVVVLDDIAAIFKSDQAIQILLAALDGDPGKVRLVTYKSKDQDRRVEFGGGVIAISNVPLRNDPLARALGSRLTVLEHEPTDDEIAAFVRLLAGRGYGDLSPDECLEVAEYVIEQTREYDLRLDLRHLTKAWQDYRQCKDGKSRTPWRELVRSSLRKLFVEPILPFTKREDIELQRQRVRELMEKYPGDTQRQLAEFGRPKSTFYNRRREVLAETAA